MRAVHCSGFHRWMDGSATRLVALLAGMFLLPGFASAGDQQSAGETAPAEQWLKSLKEDRLSPDEIAAAAALALRARSG